MTEQEIFSRCYLRLIKMPVPRTASIGKTLMDQINANTLSGTDACKQLIDKGLFNSAGRLQDANSSELRRLLTVIHNFHRSWFQSQSIAVNSAYDNSTMLLKDIDEPALYFTRAFFTSGGKAQDALTSNTSLRSIRTIATSATITNNWTSKTFNPRNRDSHPNQMELAEYFVRPNIPKIEENGIVVQEAFNTPDVINKTIPDNHLNAFGTIIGIEAAPNYSLNIHPGTLPTADTRSTAFNPLSIAVSNNFSFNQHYGGGVLGSQVYIMKNTNLQVHQVHGGTANDKDSTIPRRLTSRIFEDLLCHELPTLTEADVRADIQLNSSHGFRKEASCMRCHSSMDPLAYAYRNMVIGITAAFTDINNQHDDYRKYGSPSLVVKQVRSTDPATTAFAIQAPVGQLRYRNHENQLRSTTVNSFAQIGTSLAAEDDYYRCISKRYYHFFTGIDVKLQKLSAEESVDAKNHQAFVYQLAANLKSHQNLRAMLGQIINSTAFKSRDFSVLERK